MCNLFHSNDRTENKFCLPAVKRPKPTLRSLGTNSRAASSWVKEEGFEINEAHTRTHANTQENAGMRRKKKERLKIKKKGEHVENIDNTAVCTKVQ